jgi:hypothetical protein
VGAEPGSTAEIGLGFRAARSGSAQYPAVGHDAAATFDVRLQHQKSDKGGGSKLVSNVPFQLTTVEYSSDVRIKRQLADADTDELLQRIQQVRKLMAFL